MGCNCGGKRKYQGMTSINSDTPEGRAVASAAAAVANAGGDPATLVAVSREASKEDFR